MKITAHMDGLILRLRDTLDNYDCASRDDIRVAGGFRDLEQVSQVLTWIRNPDIAKDYGWTVPHVPRGRPQPGLTRRYTVVGAHVANLSKQDSRTVRQGAFSTMRLVSSECLNEANALRMTALTMAHDPKYQKMARNQATVLEGVAAQTGMEADRLKVALLKDALSFPSP